MVVQDALRLAHLHSTSSPRIVNSVSGKEESAPHFLCRGCSCVMASTSQQCGSQCAESCRYGMLVTMPTEAKIYGVKRTANLPMQVPNCVTIVGPGGLDIDSRILLTGRTTCTV